MLAEALQGIRFSPLRKLPLPVMVFCLTRNVLGVCVQLV